MKKFISLFLSIVLVFVCFVMVVHGTEPKTGPQTEISAFNLSFNDSVYIKIYAWDIEGSDVKMLVWKEAQESYTLGTEDALLEPVGSQTVSGKKNQVFDYNGLAAKQMADTVYFRAYAEVDGEIVYSAVKKYSILQYVYNKLGRTGAETTDENLKTLLTDMLTYGASAQRYFNYNTDRLATAAFYQVKVVGGLLQDGCNNGLYLPGDKVTLTAPPTNAEGEAFSRWVNSDGMKIAETPSFELTVTEQNETYTAVYGTSAEKYSEGLTFVSNGDKTCYVSGLGTCTDKDILIPPTSPDGDTVTSIGYEAFSACNGITSVVIPDSVTSIGAGAFQFCSNLSGITIPNSVVKIDDNAFFYCKKLTGLKLPNSVTSIGNGSFFECIGLTSLDIPDSVIYIGPAAFEYCRGLQNVTIGKGVTNISKNAFADCSGLTKITIPDNVISIGEYAFTKCTELTSVVLPDNMTDIGVAVFSKCPKLTSINIPKSVKSISPAMFFECTSLTSIEIPKNVTEIGYNAFAFCTGFQSFDIPNTITTIGGNAFEACTNLTSITIPSSVTYMDEGVFKDCTGLTSIKIPSSVKTIERFLFQNCTGLTSIDIPNTVPVISAHAFEGCTSLTSVVIPDSVTEIHYQSFKDCTGLTNITIPAGVTTIKEQIFYNCKNLSTIHFKGTKAQWNAINKCEDWDMNFVEYTIHCTDGDITK